MRKGFKGAPVWTAVFCLVLLGAALVFVRFGLGNAFSLVLRGERAIGEAEQVGDAEWVVKFQTRDGEIVRRRLYVLPRHPSEKPEILYDPRNPMRSVMRSELKVPMVLFGCFLIAACVLLARALRQYVKLARGGSR